MKHKVNLINDPINERYILCMVPNKISPWKQIICGNSCDLESFWSLQIYGSINFAKFHRRSSLFHDCCCLPELMIISHLESTIKTIPWSHKGEKKHKKSNIGKLDNLNWFSWIIHSSKDSDGSISMRVTAFLPMIMTSLNVRSSKGTTNGLSFLAIHAFIPLSNLSYLIG